MATTKEQIDAVLSTLHPRERFVLQLRFGLEDGRCRTLCEVGSELGRTRERARQIEMKALRKLRHPDRSRALLELRKDVDMANLTPEAKLLLAVFGEAET